MEWQVICQKIINGEYLCVGRFIYPVDANGFSVEIFRCSITLCDVLLEIEKKLLQNISSHPLCPSGDWFADPVLNYD